MEPTSQRTDFSFLPRPTQLVTASASMELLRATVRVNSDQAQMLAAAGVLGNPYEGAFGQAYSRERVEEIAAQPLHTVATLGSVESLRRHNACLILRLRPLQWVDADPLRAFMGAHVVTETTTDHGLRRDADEAIRKYWRIPSERRRIIERAVRDAGFLPMLVTVARRVLGGRNVTGIDDAAGERTGPKTALHVEPATNWFADFEDTWLDSGRGLPTIWWERLETSAESHPTTAAPFATNS